jgi:hypothetical protein
MRSYVDARSHTARDRAQVARLEQANARLQARVRSTTSYASMMGLARQNGWVLPGETPYSLAG